MYCKWIRLKLVMIPTGRRINHSYFLKSLREWFNVILYQANRNSPGQLRVHRRNPWKYCILLPNILFPTESTGNQSSGLSYWVLKFATNIQFIVMFFFRLKLRRNFETFFLVKLQISQNTLSPSDSSKYPYYRLRKNELLN